MRKMVLVAAVLVAGVALGAETLPSEGGKGDLLSQYLQTLDIGRQRALSLYRLAMEKSDKAMKAGEYAAAAEAARDAILVLEINRQYFGEEESATLRKDGTTAGLKALAAQTIATIKAKKTSSIEPMDKQVEQAQLEKRVAMGIEDAKKFCEQRRYIEAIDALKQVLAVDPANDQAKLQLRLVQERVGYRDFDKASERQGAEGMKQGAASKEAMIPYGDVIVYPEDWVEKTRMRVGAGE